jgi:hypothetical protein
MDGVLVWFADCSPEKTWTDVERTIASRCRFPHSTVHFPERKTHYWTWNWIVAESLKDGRPDYFSNVNVDDIHHPGYFQRMASFLDARRDVLVASCPCLMTRKKGQGWPPEADRTHIPSPERTMGHFPMWRAGIHDTVGMFDPRMVVIGDAHMWGRVKARHGPAALAVHPDFLACYVGHDNNLWFNARGPNGEPGEAWDRGLIAAEEEGR